MQVRHPGSRLQAFSADSAAFSYSPLRAQPSPWHHRDRGDWGCALTPAPSTPKPRPSGRGDCTPCPSDQAGLIFWGSPGSESMQFRWTLLRGHRLPLSQPLLTEVAAKPVCSKALLSAWHAERVAGPTIVPRAAQRNRSPATVRDSFHRMPGGRQESYRQPRQDYRDGEKHNRPPREDRVHRSLDLARNDGYFLLQEHR